MADVSVNLRYKEIWENKDVQTTIDKLQKTPIELKIKIPKNLSEAFKGFSESINKIDSNKLEKIKNDLDSISKAKSTGLSNISKALENLNGKLSAMDTSKLSVLINSLNSLSLKINPEDLTNVINVLKQLSKISIKQDNTKNLTDLTNALNQLTLKGISVSKINELSEALNKLSKTKINIKNVPDLELLIKTLKGLETLNIKNIAPDLLMLATALNTFSRTNFKTKGLDSLVKELQNLSNLNLDTNKLKTTLLQLSTILTNFSRVNMGNLDFNKLVRDLNKLATLNLDPTAFETKINHIVTAINKLNATPIRPEMLSTLRALADILRGGSGGGGGGGGLGGGISLLNVSLANFTGIIPSLKDVTKELYSLEKLVTQVGIAGELAGGQIKQLKTELYTMSISTGKAVTEIAEAAETIIKSGQTFSDTMKILDPVLKLSIASGEKLSYTAESVSKVLLALRINGEGTTEVVNKMMSVVNKTPASMRSLQEALKQSNAGFANFIDTTSKTGKALEDYKQALLDTEIAAIGGLSLLGRKGEQTGTSLRSLTTKLTTMEKTAKKLFDTDMKLNNVFIVQDRETGKLKKSMEGVEGAFRLTSDALDSLTREDLPNSIELMSKLWITGDISKKTMDKLFTLQHASYLSNLFTQIGGDIDAYNKKMTTGATVNNAFAESMDNWAYKLDKFKALVMSSETIMSGFLERIAGDYLNNISEYVKGINNMGFASKQANNAFSDITIGLAVFSTSSVLFAKGASLMAEQAKNLMLSFNALSSSSKLLALTTGVVGVALTALFIGISSVLATEAEISERLAGESITRAKNLTDILKDIKNLNKNIANLKADNIRIQTEDIASSWEKVDYILYNVENKYSDIAEATKHLNDYMVKFGKTISSKSDFNLKKELSVDIEQLNKDLVTASGLVKRHSGNAISNFVMDYSVLKLFQNRREDLATAEYAEKEASTKKMLYQMTSFKNAVYGGSVELEKFKTVLNSTVLTEEDKAEVMTRLLQLQYKHRQSVYDIKKQESDRLATLKNELELTGIALNKFNMELKETYISNASFDNMKEFTNTIRKAFSFSTVDIGKATQQIKVLNNQFENKNIEDINKRIKSLTTQEIVLSKILYNQDENIKKGMIKGALDKQVLTAEQLNIKALNKIRSDKESLEVEKESFELSKAKAKELERQIGYSKTNNRYVEEFNKIQNLGFFKAITLNSEQVKLMKERGNAYISQKVSLEEANITLNEQKKIEELRLKNIKEQLSELKMKTPDNKTAISGLELEQAVTENTIKGIEKTVELNKSSIYYGKLALESTQAEYYLRKEINNTALYEELKTKEILASKKEKLKLERDISEQEYLRQKQELTNEMKLAKLRATDIKVGIPKDIEGRIEEINKQAETKQLPDYLIKERDLLLEILNIGDKITTAEEVRIQNKINQLNKEIELEKEFTEQQANILAFVSDTDKARYKNIDNLIMIEKDEANIEKLRIEKYELGLKLLNNELDLEKEIFGIKKQRKQIDNEVLAFRFRESQKTEEEYQQKKKEFEEEAVYLENILKKRKEIAESVFKTPEVSLKNITDLINKLETKKQDTGITGKEKENIQEQISKLEAQKQYMQDLIEGRITIDEYLKHDKEYQETITNSMINQKNIIENTNTYYKNRLSDYKNMLNFETQLYEIDLKRNDFIGSAFEERIKQIDKLTYDTNNGLKLLEQEYITQSNIKGYDEKIGKLFTKDFFSLSNDELKQLKDFGIEEETILNLKKLGLEIDTKKLEILKDQVKTALSYVNILSRGEIIKFNPDTAVSGMETAITKIFSKENLNESDFGSLLAGTAGIATNINESILNKESKNIENRINILELEKQLATGEEERQRIDKEILLQKKQQLDLEYTKQTQFAGISGIAGSTLGGMASGAMAGSAIGGVAGGVIGGIVGGISGLFGGIGQAEQLKQQKAMLDEQERVRILLERNNFLTNITNETLNSYLTATLDVGLSKAKSEAYKTFGSSDILKAYGLNFTNKVELDELIRLNKQTRESKITGQYEWLKSVPEAYKLWGENVVSEEIEKIKQQYDTPIKLLENIENEIEGGKTAYLGFFNFTSQLDEEAIKKGEVIWKTTWEERKNILNNFVEGAKGLLFNSGKFIAEYIGNAFSNATIKNDVLLNSHLDNIETKLKKYSDVLLSGDVGNAKFILKDIVLETQNLTNHQKKLNNTYTDFVNSWLDLGGQVKDVIGLLPEFSQNLYGAMKDAFNETLFIDRFNKIGETLSNTISSKLAENIFSSKFEKNFRKMNETMNQIMTEDSITFSDMTSLSNQLQSFSARAEAESYRVKGILEMLNLNQSVDYTSQNQQIAYQTGSTTTNVYNISNNITIESGMMITDDQSMTYLSQELVGYLDTAFKEIKGYDLSK